MSLELNCRMEFINGATIYDPGPRETPNVLATFFVGKEGQTKQNAGTLRLHTGEAQLIGAALELGAQQTLGRLSVRHTGALSEEQQGGQDAEV